MQEASEHHDTTAMGKGLCQQFNRTDKILNVFLLRKHAQATTYYNSSWVHKVVLMTFLFTAYKNALKPKSLGSQALKWTNPRFNHKAFASSCCL